MRDTVLPVIAIFLLAACSPTAPAPEPTGAVRSAGEVVAITPEYNAVTIRHEAIPEYGMGAMTMEFTVSDPAELAAVSVGDSVTFELSGPLDITALEIADHE